MPGTFTLVCSWYWFVSVRNRQSMYGLHIHSAPIHLKQRGQHEMHTTVHFFNVDWPNWHQHSSPTKEKTNYWSFLRWGWNVGLLDWSIIMPVCLYGTYSMLLVFCYVSFIDSPTSILLSYTYRWSSYISVCLLKLVQYQTSLTEKQNI